MKIDKDARFILAVDAVVWTSVFCIGVVNHDGFWHALTIANVACIVVNLLGTALTAAGIIGPLR